MFTSEINFGFRIWGISEVPCLISSWTTVEYRTCCGTQRELKEKLPYINLRLPEKEKSSDINDMLGSHFNDYAVSYQCEVPTCRKLHIERGEAQVEKNMASNTTLSEKLIVVIPCFKWNGKKSVKDKTPTALHNTVMIQGFTYALVGVVYHIGTSIICIKMFCFPNFHVGASVESGHYVAAVRSLTAPCNWILMNDNRRDPLGEEVPTPARIKNMVGAAVPYVVAYVRIPA